MLDAFQGWLTRTRGELTQVAIEHPVEVTLPGGDGAPDVLLRGRVDRLERDSAGRPVVIDVKSSKTAVTKDAAAEHPQLAAYQLAAARGAFTELGCSDDPGGARIVQVSKSSRGAATERIQAPLDADDIARWLSVVQDAARRTAGPAFDAVENGDCERCPSRTACPLHDSGRQVP